MNHLPELHFAGMFARLPTRCTVNGITPVKSLLQAAGVCDLEAWPKNSCLCIWKIVMLENDVCGLPSSKNWLRFEKARFVYFVASPSFSVLSSPSHCISFFKKRKNNDPSLSKMKSFRNRIRMSLFIYHNNAVLLRELGCIHE